MPFSDVSPIQNEGNPRLYCLNQSLVQSKQKEANSFIKIQSYFLERDQELLNSLIPNYNEQILSSPRVLKPLLAPGITSTYARTAADSATYEHLGRAFEEEVEIPAFNEDNERSDSRDSMLVIEGEDLNEIIEENARNLSFNFL